jgi:hypothetical protein
MYSGNPEQIQTKVSGVGSINPATENSSDKTNVLDEEDTTEPE